MQPFHSEQVDQLKEIYRQCGYVIIKNFFNAFEMTHLADWTREVMDWPAVVGQWLKYYERLDNQEKVLSRIENFVQYHQGFKQLANDKEFLALLTALLGEPVLFFKEKLNVKMPGAKGYTPHQDAPAFFDIDQDAISIFIAIDPATIDNGCLYFVKQNEPFQTILLPQNIHNRALSTEIADTFHWQAAECKPGDVIIFSSYAPHYSTRNNTTNSRKAIFMTFGKKTHSVNKTNLYYDKKRKIFPQDSEKKPGVDYTRAAAIYSFSSPVIINLNEGPQHPKTRERK